MEGHLISSVALSAILSSEKNNNGAEFTIKSHRTGKDFTYKIKRSKFNNTWYTHVYVEQDYLNFKRLGTYFNGNIFHKKEVVKSTSAIAIGFVLSKVENKEFDFLDQNIDLMHIGKCLCCGKPLTDANSIAIGLGPTCSSKM